MPEEQGYQPPDETNEPAERAETSSSLETGSTETLSQEMVTKPDLWDTILEKAGNAAVIQVVLGLPRIELTSITAFQQFDKELGVYVIPDEAMGVLSPIGGMENGQAFNLLGMIGLRESTVDLIRTGNEDARYLLNHELSHNKYREAHPDLPYKSVEQNLIDEVYAHLDGFITTYGADKLSEKKDMGFGDKDWFENMLKRLEKDYVGKEVDQREQVVNKLAHALSIIKLVFQQGNDEKMMSYIKQSTGFDELLGIIPLKNQQWLADSDIKIEDHEELRRKWVDFELEAQTQPGE